MFPANPTIAKIVKTTADMVGAERLKSVAIYCPKRTMIAKKATLSIIRAHFILSTSPKCADEQVLNPDQNRQVNALLATSGMYDEAWSFAFKVGLPGKSGVGGGVIAVVPGRFSICVFSPALNAVGNSHLGVAALTSLSKRINWSVY